MLNVKFRNTVKFQDIETVRRIVESTKFFYDIEVPIAVDLVRDTFQGGKDYNFVFAEVDCETVSYACYGVIDGTIGGYDLYWIVTHNDYRGSGIGKILIEETHNRIKKDGGKYIIAETSALDMYLPTRKFYEKVGYVNEASIKDFYREGDDKIFYVKRL